MRRSGVLLVVLCALLGLTTTATWAVPDEVTRYEGEIDGARYRVMVPPDWNGTLVLWSHGTFSVDYPPPARIALTSQPATEEWLLANGYALAASQFSAVRGWSIEQGLADQVKLLDWYRRTVGPPRRTISAGESMGAATATVLAERNQGRFSGVLTLCGAVAGGAAYWNSGLDLMFGLNTLFDADIDLVKVEDPAANAAKVAAVLDRVIDPASRAKLALANALADIPGWFDPTAPRPADVAGQAEWLDVWDRYFRVSAAGNDRTDMERWAGGNPSWNVGVDYRVLLARSGERGLVAQAYAEAGLDLDADLDRLAAAPRIAPDPQAVAYLARTSLPLGLAPWPVVTVHTRGDGVLPLSNQRAYAERVAAAGKTANLRQYVVDRAGHCIFTASEEITAFRSLVNRLDEGRWPSTDPAALNAGARVLAPETQVIRNPLAGGYVPAQPSFTSHTPTRYPRPSPL